MSRFILQGIEAFAWSLKVRLPPQASPFFDNLGAGKEELLDIPLAFSLPHVDSVRKLLGVRQMTPVKELKTRVPSCRNGVLFRLND